MFSIIFSGLFIKEFGISGCLFLNTAKAFSKLSTTAFEDRGAVLRLMSSFSNTFMISHTKVPFLKESV